MSATTKDNVLLIAPELEDVDDTLWTLILNDSSNHISSSIFGIFAEEAARYWVAHRLTVLTDEKIRDTSGPIIKDKVGDVMKEFAVNKSLNGGAFDYNKTGYGLRFLSIRNCIIPNIRSVIPGI